MEQPSTWIDVLPQLSTAVVALLVLGMALYYIIQYLKERDKITQATHVAHMQQLEDMSRSHSKQLDEREQYARSQDKAFRETVGTYLEKNTEALTNSSSTILIATKTMDRLMNHIDAQARSKPSKRPTQRL